MARVGAAHRAAGHCRHVARGARLGLGPLGRWPTAADLERVAPGRRCALWAHDHHALLVSRAALAVAAIDHATPDPAGGVIRRDADGEPEGVLLESASTLVVGPHPAHVRGRSRDGDRRGRPGSAGAGRGRRPRSGRGRPRLGPRAGRSPPTRIWPRRAAFRSGSSPRSARSRSTPRSTGTCTSGMVLGANPTGRARVGWQKCFADGSLGSRTAALLADIEPEADRPLAPELRRGVWNTEPERVARARRSGPRPGASPRRSTPSAMPRCGSRSTSSNRPRGPCRSCRGSSTSSCSTRPTAADSPPAGSPPASSPSISGATPPRPAGCGASAPNRTDTPGHRSRRPGPSSRSGPMRRSNPIDPWPGIALAVCRRGPALAGRNRAFWAARGASTLERAIRSALRRPGRLGA